MVVGFTTACAIPITTKVVCSNPVHDEVGSSSIPDQLKPKTKIGICCFSAKHAALRNKSNDWLTLNQNNVSRVEQHGSRRGVLDTLCDKVCQ
jgi:hypothetical protein